MISLMPMPLPLLIILIFLFLFSCRDIFHYWLTPSDCFSYAYMFYAPLAAAPVMLMLTPFASIPSHADGHTLLFAGDDAMKR